MKKRGFSLIEILVVVIIIGFLMGIAIVQLDSVIPSSRLKSQVRNTSNLIEMAFAQSAMEGKELAMHFDKENNALILKYYFESEEQEEYFLEQAEPALENKEGEEDPLAPLFIKKWDDSISLEIIEIDLAEGEEARDFIIFSPEGMCDGARLVWKEKSGLFQEMQVWPLLGKITIFPLESNKF